MFQTRLLDVLAIDVPIVCAPFGPWDEVDLAIAVCDAGGLASLGTSARPVSELRAQWDRLREMTDRSFAINHTVRPFDEDAFTASLQFGPQAISFHQGVYPDLISRAHDAGIVWIQQVMHRAQAEEALAAGADVLVAQGSEAGGHSGSVAGMVLLPQVVDLAGDLPVVLAGGVADGRGLAAALALGASGVVMGTRFLASTEMAISAEWKQRIIDADAIDAVKAPNEDIVMPPYTRSGVPPHSPRVLRTPLTDDLTARPETIDGPKIASEFLTAIENGRGDEHLPFAGQTVGLIHDIEPAQQIISRVLDEADRALTYAHALRRPLQAR
jgi:nitronate monooxygenase/enoyl-[acyl-carrier protein] reductase II